MPRIGDRIPYNMEAALAKLASTHPNSRGSKSGSGKSETLAIRETRKSRIDRLKAIAIARAEARCIAAAEDVERVERALKRFGV